MKYYSNITVTQSNSFDNTSIRIMETDAYASILPWNIGEGHGIPNNHIHKGQSNYNCERDLYDHINSEFVNIQGMVGEYYVTTYDKNYNRIYGEDNNRRYIRKFDFMFFTDEMYEPDYSTAAGGLWFTDSNTLDVAKIGFLECSKTGSSSDTNYIDIQRGHTTNNVLSFPSYQPKVGDYIKVKSVGLFFEITNVKNRQTSLQGSSFWQITLVPMKEENSNSVSNELGMATVMTNINNVDEQRKKDLDLFNMDSSIQKEHAKIAYTDSNDTKDNLSKQLLAKGITPEAIEEELNKIVDQPITSNKNTYYDDTTAQDSFNDGINLEWD